MNFDTKTIAIVAGSVVAVAGVAGLGYYLTKKKPLEIVPTKVASIVPPSKSVSTPKKDVSIYSAEDAMKHVIEITSKEDGPDIITASDKIKYAAECSSKMTKILEAVSLLSVDEQEKFSNLMDGGQGSPSNDDSLEEHVPTADEVADQMIKIKNDFLEIKNLRTPTTEESNKVYMATQELLASLPESEHEALDKIMAEKEGVAWTNNDFSKPTPIVTVTEDGNDTVIETSNGIRIQVISDEESSPEELSTLGKKLVEAAAKKQKA